MAVSEQADSLSTSVVMEKVQGRGARGEAFREEDFLRE